MAENSRSEDKFLWAYMPQFGCNMWGEFLTKPKRDGLITKHMTDAEFEEAYSAKYQTHDRVRFEEPLWREISDRLAAGGCNFLLLDIGEFVIYPSHPELAIEGSWTPERLRTEIRRLRAKGFEVVPKINFSCCHDFWLKDYARMVSTQKYYEVTGDLIRDISEIFDRPRFIHIGMDEEDIVEYQNVSLIRMRKGDLWWHDLHYFISQIEKCGSRAWIWSDFLRRNRLEDFLKKMPKTVLQSPWNYDTNDPTMDDPEIKIYHTLATNGYDVVPCGSSCYGQQDNFWRTHRFCRQNLPAEHYKGLLFAPWLRTIRPNRRLLLQGTELFAQAVKS